jgi:hypothetical protein
VEAPETYLVLARALQGVMQLDEAEQAFERAIAMRPDYLDAHHDLAQLRWMWRGDLQDAASALDTAMVQTGDQGTAAVSLMVLRSKLDLTAGQYDDAVRRLELGVGRYPRDSALRLAAAQANALAGRSGAQMAHAIEALRLAPSSVLAAKAAVEALLAEARPEEARDLAERILAHHPNDQRARALLHTAWLVLGDPRGIAAYEDTVLIRSLEVETPKGWTSREAWLTALASTLRARHGWTMHPLEQSLRDGSQTQEDLSRCEDPPIRDLFDGIRRTVGRYIADLGPGDDPTRARATQDWRFTGAWSVLLRPGGFHIDHVHPEGWISSAFHVEAPAATEQAPQGWLAFGRPGIATRPGLEPVHHIRPRPGHLVLFPSFCWHGTEPFAGDEDRLTIAFDIVPA